MSCHQRQIATAENQLQPLQEAAGRRRADQCIGNTNPAS